MNKPEDEANLEAATEHLVEQFEKTGVATCKAEGGRIFLFSIDILHDLIDAALSRNSGQVSVFIKDDLGPVN